MNITVKTYRVGILSSCNHVTRKQIKKNSVLDALCKQIIDHAIDSRSEAQIELTQVDLSIKLDRKDAI